MAAKAPNSDKLIFHSDDNARTGTGWTSRDGVIWRNGIGKCNSNGIPLLKMCAAYQLLITNTVFHFPTYNRNDLDAP